MIAHAQIRQAQYLWCCFFALLFLITAGGCSPNAGGTAEYYNNAENINPSDTGHDHFHRYVVGQVFFGVYLSSVDETTVTGGPPFRINFGIYSLAEESVPVEIVAAEAQIGTHERFHIEHRFPTLKMQSELRSDRCDDCGHFGSSWLHTGYFLDASPANDETVTLFFRVRVGEGAGEEEGELVFEFLPLVKRIGSFRART